MSRFIEITDENNNRRFLNVNYIEEIAEKNDTSCFIYLAFNCPDAITQDYFVVKKSYDEVVSMIMKGGASDA